MHSDAVMRAQRNKTVATLLEKQGWVSTGDVPYRFGRLLGRSSGSIASHLSKILEKLLDALGDEYRSAHVRRIGCRRFISPDCTQRLMEYVVEYGPTPKVMRN